MSQPLDYAHTPLRRQIGLGGAVMLGLGAILGSGVFVGLPQATAIAGPWVLLAILLAGGLAFCNAMSSAQLAAAHPVSGGTYEYGYRLLSPAWGFTAGWSFLLAKSASAATAALAIGHLILHALPNPLVSRLGGDAIVTTAGSFLILCAMVIAVLAHLRRTSSLNIAIVACTLAGISAGVVATVPQALSTVADVDPEVFHSMVRIPLRPNGIAAIAEQAALAFVGFAGYARLATLGEEVREPQRTIPRAILCTLAAAVLIYLAIGMICSARVLVATDLLDAGPVTFERVILDFVGHGWVYRLVCFAAVTAMLGVLLNLILGLSRVWLAMGRRGDMPAALAQVSERTGTPVPATIVSGIVIALLILIGRDVRTTWSFSAFSVLIYYAITNLACLRLPAEQRRYPRALAWVGLFACLSLAWFVAWRVWAVGVALIGLGLMWHLWRQRRLTWSAR